MNRVTHDCQQGTQAWLDLRAKYFTASELAAAAGESKYQSRSALLKAKATGIAEEVDYAKQRLFDAGHASEAAARPIVERMVDAELYPVTMSVEIDGLPLLASLDGIDILGDVIWENKLRSDSLVEQVNAGRLDPHYTYQIEQQLLVSGAGRCYFTTSDGTPEGTFGMWYESNPEIRAKIVSIWQQFAADLVEYQHVEAKPAVVADTIEDLPALTVQLVGQVTASNLDSFTTAVTARIQAINTKLVTDADFVNADKMVKFLGDGEKRLDLVKDQALAQTASIDQLFRTIDVLKEQMRGKRLALEKLVKAEKENRKSEIVHAARVELVGHVQNLHSRIGFTCIQIDSSVFGEATKGLKSLDSMRDKVSAALANAKIEANAIADRIEFNQKQMQEKSAAVLFPDFAQVCTKAPDDFAALVDVRIAKKKEADDNLLAAEREKIRAEEVARANAEAVAKIMAPAPVAAETTKAPEPCRANDSRRIGLGASASRLIDSISEIKRVKLGTICARLGFTMTAEFVESLGFRPVEHDKNAKLYSETQFLEICEALIQHISKQANAERSE
jgi:putative phage-type endonuclease